MSGIYDALLQRIREIQSDVSLTPAQKEAKKREVKEAASRQEKEAVQLIRHGAERAGNAVSARMRPISNNAAVAAKMLVDRGIPPGQAIKAAARVAEWKFLFGELGPFEADAVSLSTAPIQLWRRRIQQEF